MLFSKHFRRSEAPWEVLDCKDVTPISMWDEDEDLDVVRMHHSDLTFKWSHELRRVTDVRSAVQFARYQLMQDAARLHYNILLSEGWQCTLLRKGNKYRVDVVYSGRPAFAAGKITSHPPPPFIGVLDHCQHQLHTSMSALPTSSARVRRRR